MVVLFTIVNSFYTMIKLLKIYSIVRCYIFVAGIHRKLTQFYHKFLISGDPPGLEEEM